MRQNGQEDVQLEIALRGRKADPGSVRHDLHGNHRQRLALRRVDLAGHDGGAGLVFGDEDLAQAVARAGGQPAHVVGDLHQVRRQRLERAVRKDELVLAGQGVELVGRGDEGLARELGDGLGDLDVKALGRVQARADGRAAQGQLLELGQGDLQHLLVLLQGGAPAADLLGELDGRGVLQVGCGRT